MVNYKFMYSTLCSAMSEALDCLEKGQKEKEAIEIMICALREAEEIYINSYDTAERPGV